jgi:NitT/TauT family transport system ATP-binding protein
MLTVKNVSKTFTLETEIITAVRDVSFSIKKGEFFTVIGPSGCGKSTLLRLLAGLDTPTNGSITWDEKPNIGFVFQNFALLPYLTVAQNIEFGLKMRGETKDKTETIVKKLLDEMELSEFKDKHPHELSGGMKQRVGIARSLAIEPNTLLLDEPFSSLDEFTAETLRNLLLDIWQERKITIVLITHLVREALELSDRIAIMSKAPGTILEVIKNTLPRPRNLRSKEFFALEDKLTAIIKK